MAKQTFKQDSNELMKAIKSGKEHKIPKLLDNNNINTRTKEGTPLTLALERKMFGVAKKFISKGADVMALDDKGRNALMLSILKENQELFEQIMLQKNQFDHKDSFGSTALMYACLKKNAYFVERIIAQKVELNCVNIEGNTALIIASICNSYDCVKLLLREKINVNEKNKLGKNALMYSAGNGNLRIFELLLNHGAKVYEKDHEQNNVLEIAIINGCENIIERLLKKGINEVKESIISNAPLHQKHKIRKIFEKYKIIL